METETTWPPNSDDSSPTSSRHAEKKHGGTTSTGKKGTTRFDASGISVVNFLQDI
jgi:hypothetical protein